jgi:Tol biopolymer transport system component/DNA-binding winged helix-turn-helix (wHTH) protein
MSVERFPSSRIPGREPARDFRIGDHLVRPSLNRVSTPEQTVTLEPKVMRVLARLAAQPGSVVTKEELFRDVWDGAYVTEDVLTRAVGELRRLFGDEAGRPRVIETIRKSGYRLIAPVVYEVEIAPPPGPAVPSGVAGAGSRFRTRLAIGLAALVVAAAAVFLVARSRPSERAPMRVRPLTTFPGDERDPAVSPDGTRVAFAWNGGAGEDHSLYVKLVDGETLLRLTNAPGAEDRTPAWSPDGQRLAFTRSTASDCRILFASALGGEEKPVAPCGDRDYRRLAWSPDGRWLALPRRDERGVFGLEMLSLETLERKALTRAPDGILGDTSPAFSPDGRTLAFTRNVTDSVGDIFLVSAEGGVPRRLTFDDRDTMGSDWSGDGRGVFFSSARAGIYSLWRAPAAGGEPAWVAGGGTKMKHPTSARARRLIAYESWVYEVNLWRAGASEGAGSRLTESTDEWNYEPAISPDGARVAFVSTRSGATEVWVSDADGARPRRLTSFGGARVETPRWSPDGRRLVFSARAPARSDLYLIDAEGGVPARITEQSDALAPEWSRDGKSITFASRESGSWQVWRLDLESRRRTPATEEGGYASRESPDGKWLFTTRPDAPGIWRRNVAGGPSERVTDLLAPEDWANWDAGARGLYLRARAPQESRAVLAMLPYDGGAPVELGTLPDQGWAGLAVSPDGAWFVSPRVDRHTCDIRLIENPS